MPTLIRRRRPRRPPQQPDRDDDRAMQAMTLFIAILVVANAIVWSACLAAAKSAGQAGPDQLTAQTGETHKP